MSGVWLLPSRGRPQNLRRFLNAAREMGSVSPGWILVDDDDYALNQEAYAQALALAPPGWEFRVQTTRGYGNALRAVWDDVRGMDWVGLVADDVVPGSMNWDTNLLRHLKGWNFVTANDGKQMPARMHGATIFSGDLLRAVGWLFPPELRHVFHDDVWETIARETGAWEPRMEILTRHLHEFYETGERGPTMDPSSELWKHDQAVFEAWRDGGERAATVQRIKAFLATRGLKVFAFENVRGARVMLATPTATGRYERQYMFAFIHTMKELAQHGVHLSMIDEAYTADIALARANLFSAFVRSDATHLLMIDDDMGWDAKAVLRMLDVGRDFVAVAGPKKLYPLQFAANYTDDQGNVLPMPLDTDKMVFEVGEIGAAFMLLTKKAALEIAEAYDAEFGFDNATGERCWGVFTPMVRKRRWFSEDFAFAKRWREINPDNKVWMVPDVMLTHTGMHTFQGSFSQTLKVVPPQPVEAPLQEAAE